MGYKIVILAKLVFLIIFNWLDNCLISNKIRDLGHSTPQKKRKKNISMKLNILSSLVILTFLPRPHLKLNKQSLLNNHP